MSDRPAHLPAGVAAPASTRDPGLDALRGFLILCVVAGHLPLGNFLGSQPWWWGWLNETIYLFHVPLFLVLGAVLSTGAGWWRLVRGFLAVLVPYVLWFGWQQHQVLWRQPLVWLEWVARGNFASLQSVLWFLPTMVAVRLLAAPLVTDTPRPGQWAAILGAWLAAFACLDWVVARHDVIPFGLDVAFLCLPYGALIVLVERQRHRLTTVPPIAWLCLAIGLGLWVYMTEPLKTHTPWHKRIDLAQLSLPHSLGGYLAWSGLGACWWMTCRRLSWRPLVLLGRHSLPIFLMHYEVFKLFLINPEHLPGGPGILATVLVIALSIFVPLGISLAARRVWSGSRWLGL